MTPGTYYFAVMTCGGASTGYGTGWSNYQAVTIAEYSITPTLTHATAAASNPSVLRSGDEAVLTYTFDGIEWICPSTIGTITGATGAWSKLSDMQG